MGDIRACDGQAVLSQSELAVIEALPDGAHELDEELSCELEAGHAGPHLGLVQAYGIYSERSRWLRWDGNNRDWLDIEDVAHCDAEGLWLAGGGVEEKCLLLDGHPGRHTFEFGVPA